MKLNAKFWGKCIEILCMLLIPVVVAMLIINNIFPDLLMGEKVMKAMDDLYGYNPYAFSILQRICLFLIGAVSAAFMVYGLWIGIKIARLSSKGETFSTPSALLFAQLKKMSLYWGLYNMTQITFTYIVLMPKMQKSIMFFGLGMMGLTHLFMYVLFAGIAAVVARAAKLQDDQDLTV